MRFDGGAVGDLLDSGRDEPVSGFEPAGTGFVARQRPVQIGEVRGNGYVVKGGLKPGERLIVSGIQKIGDGAPVKPEPAAAGAPPVPQ